MKWFLKKTKLPQILLLVILIAFYIFPFVHWFISFNSLTATDFSYQFFSSFKDYTLQPFIWAPTTNTGFGGNLSYALWTYFFWAIPMQIGIFFHLSWEIVERVFFFYPLLILGFITPFLAYKKILNKSGGILTTFIFMLNSYCLMLIGGGQNIIVMADLVCLLLLTLFILGLAQKKLSFSQVILYGVLLAINLMLDLRIFYITLIILVCYWLYRFLFNENKKNFVLMSVFSGVVSGTIVCLLNSFWILPLILSKKSPVGQLGSDYLSVGAAKFLSFNKFEYGLSLLHPNWPENIFGKVDFLKPEFLLLPIFAFSSLLFFRKGKREIRLRIIFLNFLALIGIFLAKGTNDPFGFLYIWFFQHVPGFIMFRDPTKWYLLIVITYSLLIPYSLSRLSQARYIVALLGKRAFNFVAIVFVLYLVLLLRPVYSNSLLGTFKPQSVPKDYQKLADLENAQKDFYRTLWMPSNQKFAFNSYIHPVVSGSDYFKVFDPTILANVLQKPGMQERLSEASVRYIIIPYDTDSTIFVTDRKYNAMLHNQFVAEVRKIHWLHELKGFSQIHVFEVTDYKKHFWTSSSEQISFSEVNPSEYKIARVTSGEKVIFSEGFDPGWTAVTKDSQIESKPFKGTYNSFTFPSNSSDVTITYEPQKWADLGLLITVLTFGGVVVTYVYNLVSRRIL